MIEPGEIPPGVDATRPSPARSEDPVAADSDGSRGYYGGVARRH